MPRRKPRSGNFGELWKQPAAVRFDSLNTQEQFPGKKFAQDAANWLNLGMRTNVSVPQRKRMAKKGFGEALWCCTQAKEKAVRDRNAGEAQRLTEIMKWLQGWIDSIK